MANPRQRSKAKSHKTRKPSLSQKKRLHAKLRKAPALRGPEALQEAWDRKKTVFQNYAALGLLPSIPVPKGPSTRVKLPLLPPTESDEVDPAAPKIGFGRIIRDDDGNVIDIIIDGEEDDDEDKVKPLNEVEAERAPVVAKTAVVQELERLAATAAPVVRHTSSAEKLWLARLTHKHGDDYSAAARDRKLNVWQKTPGELKRMVRKAGGVEALAMIE